MRYCFALDPGEFDRHGPWAPTHEHFPLAKRLGGKREVTNAVLAHRRCNNVGHKIEELQQVLEHLRLEDHTPVRTEAIDAAIADHVKQRRAAEGRYPRKRGSRKRGETIARETHQNLERSAQGEAA
jgi:hypothetical protein